MQRFLWLKGIVKSAIETALDILIDWAMPHSLLSRTRLKHFSVPTWVPCHHVLNQKVQRLEILDMLRESGIKNPERLKVWWSRHLGNFGDELMPYLLARIAGADCLFDRKKHLLGIGSTVRLAQDHSYVWGSGIIRDNEAIVASPKCLAVRGPLTRNNLKKHGIPCPKVFGDPAMLFPLIYRPTLHVTNSIGLVVPHFKHTNLLDRIPDFEFIDLHVRSKQKIESVIDHIASARCVLTSSLHAFIFSVAYGVPVAVFKLESQNIGGDNIKFDDFCLGVGMERFRIHTLHNAGEGDLRALVEKAEIYTPNWSATPLLNSLKEICNSPSIDRLIEKAASMQ
ncbi:MAG: polysaccharide pyruvyl transferase family protein [Pseudomonadota bacterium]